MLISRKDCDIININQGHIPVSERVSDTVNTPERHNNNTGNRRRSPVPPRAPKGQPSDTRARSGAGRQPSPRPDTYSAARPVQRNPAPSDLQNNLKSQTPLNRRMRQKTAPAEPGTRRRATKPQYYRIKEEQERKKKRTVFGYRVLLVLVIYAVLMPVSLLLFRLWLPRHTSPETRNYTYIVMSGKSVVSRRSYPWSTVRSENVYYLDMTGIADLCGMTTTGDAESLKYTVRASGESVRFTVGQSLAYVNGIPERMESDCEVKNGRLYVPMDFVNRCFSGISAELDSEKNRITVTRETDDETGDEVTVSFAFKKAEAISAIDFNSLDHDIKQQILLREETNKPGNEGNDGGDQQ